MESAAFIKGMGLGGGLIIAIGAQNAFVLRQGLQRQYVLTSALICSLCDAMLIAFGVAGVGAGRGGPANLIDKPSSGSEGGKALQKTRGRTGPRGRAADDVGIRSH